MNSSEIEALVEAKVNAKFQMIFQVLGGSQPKTEWVDSNQAAIALGIPKKELYKAISSGLLRLSDGRKEFEVRDRRHQAERNPVTSTT